MKNLLLFLAFLGLFWDASAQGGGNLLYGSENRYNFKNASEIQMQSSIQYDNTQISDPNTVTFNVRGLLNKKADAQLAIFNMTQVGETASKANQVLNSRYEAFLNDISSYVDKDDVYLDMVSQVPIYEVEVTKKLFSKTYNEVPKGFELQKNIHIIFREAEALDKILEAAARHEIYDLIKIDYYVEDGSHAYQALRDTLLGLVEQKVASYNKLLDTDLDTVYKSVQENDAVTFPVDRYSQYTPASSSSVEALDRKSGVTTARRPTIMFYDKLSYHNFDVVVNPVVLEPVVQYTYQIKVQFHRKRPVKTKIENHYKIITTNGEVKTLDVN